VGSMFVSVGNDFKFCLSVRSETSNFVLFCRQFHVSFLKVVSCTEKLAEFFRLIIIIIIIILIIIIIIIMIL
jgi:hypothetical protein